MKDEEQKETEVGPQYLVMGPGRQVFMVGSKSQVSEFILEDDAHQDLRIFKECKFRAKVVTVLEMED